MRQRGQDIGPDFLREVIEAMNLLLKSKDKDNCAQRFNSILWFFMYHFPFDYVINVYEIIATAYCRIHLKLKLN